MQPTPNPYFPDFLGPGAQQIGHRSYVTSSGRGYSVEHAQLPDGSVRSFVTMPTFPGQDPNKMNQWALDIHNDVQNRPEFKSWNMIPGPGGAANAGSNPSIYPLEDSPPGKMQFNWKQQSQLPSFGQANTTPSLAQSKKNVAVKMNTPGTTNGQLT